MSEQDTFEQTLARIAAVSAEPEVDEWTWSLREAAAVRSTFDDPRELTPLGGSRGDPAQLLEDCRLIELPTGEARWLLDDTVRAQALRRAASHARLAELIELNRAPDDSLQRQLEAVAGKGVALDGLSFEDLTQVLRISGWLGGVLPGVPSAEVVERHLELSDMTAPLRLVQDFRGREDVLAQLDEHVFPLD